MLSFANTKILSCQFQHEVQTKFVINNLSNQKVNIPKLPALSLDLNSIENLAKQTLIKKFS